MSNKLIITKNNIFDLIKGTSVLSTGGGVPLGAQKEVLEDLPSLCVQVKGLEDFDPDGYLFTAAEVGPSEAPEIEKKPITKHMFDLLQKNCSYPIIGIYPSELGQESIILQTAHYLNLPIANFDPTGLRAVPFTDITLFNLKNIPLSYNPIVVANDKEELFVIDGELGFGRVEELLRDMTVLSQTGIVFYIGALVKVKSILMHGPFTSTYTKAIQVGSMKSLDELLHMLKPKKVFSCAVTSIQKKTKKGFLYQEVSLSSDKKNLSLIILNETLFLLEKNKLLAQIPERILLITPAALTGIPSGDLKVGQEVELVILPPEKPWDTKKAQKLFGKERFKDMLK